MKKNIFFPFFQKTVQPFSLSLESSDEEDQPAEANKKVKRTRKPPSRTIEAMDKAAHGSNPQQRHINVKMSTISSGLKEILQDMTM